MGFGGAPGAGDLLSYWLINVVAGFFLSAAHNVLYFVLDIRTPVIHFLHHFNTFLVLLQPQLARRDSWLRRAPDLEKGRPGRRRLLLAVAPPALLQALLSLVSARIHSQNRTGSLYLLR